MPSNITLPPEWVIESNYVWRYNADPCDVKEAHVMLTGANVDPEIRGSILHADFLEQIAQSFLQYCDETNAIIIVLDSTIIQPISGPLQQTWDYTNNFSWGSETSKIVMAIRDVRAAVPKVWLHGGSAGAIMAWNVVNALEQAGRIDFINGVILAETVSCYSLSFIPGVVPVNYKSIPSTPEFNILGVDFYDVGPTEIDAQLGFPNSSVTFPKQMLSQYSVADPLMPERWKEDFNSKLSTRATALTVGIVGTGHDIGEKGWENVVFWLENAA